MADDKDLSRALATVRPGMPVAELRQIAGGRWRDPAAHRQGKVDCLEYKIGFSAQIGIDGRVGRVQFGTTWVNPPFSSGVDIAGLRIGMSPEAAKRARPDLAIHEARHPTPTSGMGQEKDGSQLRLQFLFDKLRVIELVNEQAVYPPPMPTPYPAAEEPAGAPFKDPNLKLAVMSELLDRHLLDLGTPRELASFVLGRPVDLDADGYEMLPAARDYLVRYPLSQELLDAVDTLTFDGGSSIYNFAWYFWGGETHHFDIVSLEGIEACRNLEAVHVIAVFAVTDLSPLQRLPKLRVRKGL